MKKYISILVLSIAVISCKSKAVAVQGNTSQTIAPKEDKKVIEKHYDNKLDFSTLYIKASANSQLLDFNQFTISLSCWFSEHT